MSNSKFCDESSKTAHRKFSSLSGLCVPDIVLLEETSGAGLGSDWDHTTEIPDESFMDESQSISRVFCKILLCQPYLRSIVWARCTHYGRIVWGLTAYTLRRRSSYSGGFMPWEARLCLLSLLGLQVARGEEKMAIENFLCQCPLCVVTMLSATFFAVSFALSLSAPGQKTRRFSPRR